MIKIYGTDGALISIEDGATFAKKGRNGKYALCRECEADALIAAGSAYALSSIVMESFSGAETIAELDEEILALTYEKILYELGV